MTRKMTIRKLAGVTNKRLNVYQQKNSEFPARAGNVGTGELKVAGTTNTIYVTVEGSGAVLTAIIGSVSVVFGTPIIIGYLASDKTQTLRVLRTWAAFGANENPSDGVKDHALQHQRWQRDPLWVYGEQILTDLLVPVPGTLSVKMYPGSNRITGGYKTYTQRTTLDLTAYVPSTAGKAKYVLVVVNSAGAYAVRDGAEVTGYANLADANIPDETVGDRVKWAVKLFSGQAEVRNTADVNDLIDLRFSGADGVGSAGAGGVPTTRTISTTAPLTGGGDLSANRTLAMAAATSAVDGYMTASAFSRLANTSGTNTGDQPLVTWSEVSGTAQAMAVNKGYVANNAGLVTLTLPSSAVFGSIFEVTGIGAGGWKIAQNAGQIIYFGNKNTTSGVGGYLASVDDRDAVKLLCVVANTTFQVLSSVGNITYA